VSEDHSRLAVAASRKRGLSARKIAEIVGCDNKAVRSHMKRMEYAFSNAGTVEPTCSDEGEESTRQLIQLQPVTIIKQV
jgi:hypothetical protein